MLDELLSRTDPSAADCDEYDSDLYGEEPAWRRGGGGRLLGRLRGDKAPKKKRRAGPNVSEWKLYLVQGEEEHGACLDGQSDGHRFRQACGGGPVLDWCMPGAKSNCMLSAA